MDRAWEMGVTIAAGVAVALFLAYHHGKGTPDVTINNPPPKPLDPDKYPKFSDISGYDPAQNIPGGIDVNLTYNLNVTAPQILFQLPEYKSPNSTINNYYPVINLTDLPSDTFTSSPDTTPANITTGSPQCGCSDGAGASNAIDINAVLKQNHDEFQKILDNIADLPIIRPVSNIYVTLTQQAAPRQEWNFTSNPEQSYDVTDASGAITRHFTGYH